MMRSLAISVRLRLVTLLYIPSFIEIRSWVSEPQRVEIRLITLAIGFYNSFHCRISRDFIVN